MKKNKKKCKRWGRGLRDEASSCCLCTIWRGLSELALYLIFVVIIMMMMIQRNSLIFDDGDSISERWLEGWEPVI